MYSVSNNTFVLGSPIRIFTDQSLFSAPRDFSQSITSFIASHCQGIHQMPFSSWFSLCVCVILSHTYRLQAFASCKPSCSSWTLYVFTHTRYKLYIYANTFKDLIYIITSAIIYTRYTSYSLCPNNTLTLIKDKSSISTARSNPLNTLGGGERVWTDDP